MAFISYESENGFTGKDKLSVTAEENTGKQRLGAIIVHNDQEQYNGADIIQSGVSPFADINTDGYSFSSMAGGPSFETVRINATYEVNGNQISIRATNNTSFNVVLRNNTKISVTRILMTVDNDLKVVDLIGMNGIDEVFYSAIISGLEPTATIDESIYGTKHLLVPMSNINVKVEGESTYQIFVFSITK